jgi:hypothetical protein
MKVAAGLVRPNLPPALALRDDPHGFSRSGVGGHLWPPLALAGGVGWVVGAPPPPCRKVLVATYVQAASPLDPVVDLRQGGHSGSFPTDLCSSEVVVATRWRRRGCCVCRIVAAFLWWAPLHGGDVAFVMGVAACAMPGVEDRL